MTLIVVGSTHYQCKRRRKRKKKRSYSEQKGVCKSFLSELKTLMRSFNSTFWYTRGWSEQKLNCRTEKGLDVQHSCVMCPLLELEAKQEVKYPTVVDMEDTCSRWMLSTSNARGEER